MEWLLDPTIWVGLLTRVVLEIVLGIDNLIFIAILAEKLPPHQRDKARVLGLTLALVMRLGLLTLISWLVTLTAPLFSVWQFTFSGRDLILLVGGIFLLFKATTELHERLEGVTHTEPGSKVYAGFGLVVAQIVVLDAVFSLDAVITAVGMVENLYVMMAAVIISIGVMMLASKSLTRFVNAHPTVVVLCLSFLLMIGLSLVAEGLGFHIPKGYLYAAIGFSVVIEFFNQLARRNFLKLQSHTPLRDRTAQAVLSLLGGRKKHEAVEEHEVTTVPDVAAFGVAERNMVSGVLTLAERSIRSVMTPRGDVSWVNLNDSKEKMLQLLRDTPHSMIPVCHDDLDNVVGLARSKDLIEDLVSHGEINTANMREAIVVPEAAGVLKAMETLKRSHGQPVLVVDEFGTVQGVLTPIDILEAIAGEFPDEDEQPDVQLLGAGHWRVDGATDLHYLEQVFEKETLVSEDGEYNSLAGFLLAHFENMPAVGEVLELDGMRYEVLEADERRIACVDVRRIEPDPGQ